MALRGSASLRPQAGGPSGISPTGSTSRSLPNCSPPSRAKSAPAAIALSSCNLIMPPGLARRIFRSQTASGLSISRHAARNCTRRAPLASCRRTARQQPFRNHRRPRCRVRRAAVPSTTITAPSKATPTFTGGQRLPAQFNRLSQATGSPHARNEPDGRACAHGRRLRLGKEKKRRWSRKGYGRCNAAPHLQQRCQRSAPGVPERQAPERVATSPRTTTMSCIDFYNSCGVWSRTASRDPTLCQPLKNGVVPTVARRGLGG